MSTKKAAKTARKNKVYILSTHSARSEKMTIKKIKHNVLATAYSRREQALLPSALVGFQPKADPPLGRKLLCPPRHLPSCTLFLAPAYSPREQAQVPSALKGLTSVFGMGTGVPPSQEAPRIKYTNSKWRKATKKLCFIIF